MQAKGKLTHKLDLVTGQGSNGEWRKQSFVIEIGGKYPKSICFDVWSDTIQYLDKANIGDNLTVEFDLESREYNGRWFTNAKAWKIEASGVLPTEPSQDTTLPPDDTGDLPF